MSVPLPNSELLSEQRGIEARLAIENDRLLDALARAQESRDTWRRRYVELALRVGERLGAGDGDE